MFKILNKNYHHLFLLDIFLDVKSVKYLHYVHFEFYFLKSAKSIFYGLIRESREDKFLNTRDDIQNIKINVAFLLNILLFYT